MADNTKVQEIINSLAAAARAIANSSDSPAIDTPARVASVLLGAVARALGDSKWSPEEIRDALLKLTFKGTGPVSADELDAQLDELVSKLQ